MTKPIHVAPDAHSFGGNVCTTREEVQRLMLLYVAARRQSRFWRQHGYKAWAADLRIRATRFLGSARFRKAHPLEAEGAPKSAPAPAAIPQPICQDSK